MGSPAISSDPITRINKAELRRDIRRRRRALSPRQRHNAARGLLGSLRHFPHFQYSQHIAVYLTHDGEMNTRHLIRDLQQRGRTLYLPVLHPLRRGHLSFVRWQSHTRMQRNRFGIAEPHFAGGHRIAARFLNLICMPLVAFDDQGNRLGMGGGFYDRTLAFMHARGQKPALLGCAYELQKVPALPTEPWDIALSAIATERKLYRFSR